MTVGAANGACGHHGACNHKHHHGAHHHHHHAAEAPKMAGDSASAPSTSYKPTAEAACKHEHNDHCSGEACSHASDDKTKAQRKSFFDTLIDHPVLKGMQAVMSVLMVPMIPLIAYELYKGSTTPFQAQSTVPAASSLSLMA